MNRIQEEIKHFGELDHVWFGQMTKAGQKRYDNKATLFRKYCKPRASYRILEIGCGDGLFTRRLAASKVRILATDITPAVIERGERSIKNKLIKFKVENCEKLSFKDNTFDIVCGISILHHVGLKKTLSEAYRVLKPGGKIFFTEPNINNPILFAQTNVKWIRDRMEFSPREKPLKRKDVDSILKTIGFKSVIVKNYDFLFPWIPSFMIGLLESVGSVLEKTPILKEFSGSLLIFASK